MGTSEVHLVTLSVGPSDVHLLGGHHHACALPEGLGQVWADHLPHWGLGAFLGPVEGSRSGNHLGHSFSGHNHGALLNVEAIFTVSRPAAFFPSVTDATVQPQRLGASCIANRLRRASFDCQAAHHA